MTSLFISYSRRDIGFAKHLTDVFHSQDLDFWIDWEGIAPSMDWRKQIEKGIEEADVFLFLISPDSAKSQVCKWEIDHAIKNGKRLIPIVVRDAGSDEVPKELGHLHWIFFRENDDFESAFRLLIAAIKTDYEWVQAHSQLQNKALEWERNNKDGSFLLQGKELQFAEFQLATNATKAPHATPLQEEYVSKSRQGSNRQRKVRYATTVAVGIGLALLALYGWIQAGRATTNAQTAQTQEAIAHLESTRSASSAATAQAASTLAVAQAEEALKQARIARAGELAAMAVSIRDTQFDVSLLLSVEAQRTWDLLRTRHVLLENLLTNPRLFQYFNYGYYTEADKLILSPNGKTLASANISGDMIALWDMDTGQALDPITTDLTFSISSIAFSTDGQTLVSGNTDGTISFWDIATGQPTRQPLVGSGEYVEALAVSPNDEFIASVSIDRTLILWDLRGKIPVDHHFTNLNSYSPSITFSPDGKLLAIDNDKSIVLLDVETSTMVGPPIKTDQLVMSLVFSPDGQTIASLERDDSVSIWDLTKGQWIDQPLEKPESGITSIAYHPDNKTLVYGDLSGTITLWDLESHQSMELLPNGHNGKVEHLIFSPDGKTLVSGGFDRVIRWDLQRDQHAMQTLDEHNAFIHNMVLNQAGTTLAYGNYDNSITLWDVKADQAIGQALIGHTDFVTSLAFSADGRILASGSADNSIILWDVSSHQVIGSALKRHASHIESLAFSPDGELLASGDLDGSIILWEVASGQPVGQLLQGEVSEITSLAFSPDGTILASGSPGGMVSTNFVLWNVEDQQTIGQPITVSPESLTSIAFSPDGKILALGGLAADFVLWDLETGQMIGQPLMSDGPVTSLSFSPDGNMLATGSGAEVQLWDVPSRQRIGPPLQGHSTLMTTLTFSPDGNTLVSASNDTAVISWDVNPQSWLERNCRRAGRNLDGAEWSIYFPGEEQRAICPQWPLLPNGINDFMLVP